MRAVTEPYSPPHDESLASDSTRNTERRALDTCAIDRQEIDDALANAAPLIDDIAPPDDGQAELAGDSAVDTLEAPVFVHPVWAQLAHLENLLGQWMTGNPACEQALADLHRREPPLAALAAPSRATTVTQSAPRAGNDYVSKLAAKLVRRSA